MVPIKNSVGKSNPLVQNNVGEARNMPLSPATIRNCINKQIMYIKSDTNQGIGKTNFPKRWGGEGEANDLKLGG